MAYISQRPGEPGCWPSLSLGLLLLTLVVSVLTGCASAPDKQASDRPEWVTRLPERPGYLYGVGSADHTGSEAAAAETARERARADLIRQMQVEVRAEFSSETRLQIADGVTSGLVEQVNDRVFSRIPEVELPGLGWSNTWVNPETKTHYVLAELNRRGAEAQLAEQLSAIDLELADKTLPATVTKEGVPVSRIDQVREAMPVLTLFAKRDKLADQLMFVAQSGFSRYVLDERSARLHTRLLSLLSELRIEIHATQASDASFNTALSQALTQRGFVVAARDLQGGDLQVYYDLRAAQRERDELHYTFLFADILVRDERGRVVVGYKGEAKGVSGIEERAHEQAINNLAEHFVKQLASALIQ